MTTVLCYHALSPSWNADLSTTPDRFAAQIRLLLRRGYRLVTFSEAVTAPPEAKVAAITFDDAFASVFVYAFPLLDRLGVPATLFVPTDYIEQGGPLSWPGIDHWHGGAHAGELSAMTWPQIRRLVGAGWEIGSHTASHPHLTTLSDADLGSELSRSRTTCAVRLDVSCDSIAYPFGDVDSRVATAAHAAGYVNGAALPGALNGRDPLQWPRVGVYRVDSALRFRLKLSPAVWQARVIVGRRAAGRPPTDL